MKSVARHFPAVRPVRPGRADRRVPVVAVVQVVAAWGFGKGQRSFLGKILGHHQLSPGP
ncbi:hypothetical protein [Arthrobacter sp. STN4]|uniref:hypothetical protein n=1 Tax=Arthrobacter sp. STN4 TaxID=2923276 RepID=UPI002119C445|nr:hypothetical protein [Arthrobacter sp. STN4]MCQ9162465.1 hypothetical protein [Arthrobacter sp. STN4]